jgi:hypothetical protein
MEIAQFYCRCLGMFLPVRAGTVKCAFERTPLVWFALSFESKDNSAGGPALQHGYDITAVGQFFPFGSGLVDGTDRGSERKWHLLEQL